MARNGLKRMLIDNRSLVNIIYGAAFDKMEVDHELTLMTSHLYGFTSNSIIPLSKITLETEMRVTPLMAHHFIEFLVVDHYFAYYRVLGRPSLKELWITISIHLCA